VLGPDLNCQAFTLLGYGPVPGVELIPYFLALLAWVGFAFFSVLLTPITALLRLFRRGKHREQAASRDVKREPDPTTSTESQRD
jgi:hypothetical protein